MAHVSPGWSMKHGTTWENWLVTGRVSRVTPASEADGRDELGDRLVGVDERFGDHLLQELGDGPSRNFCCEVFSAGDLGDGVEVGGVGGDRGPVVAEGDGEGGIGAELAGGEVLA